MGGFPCRSALEGLPVEARLSLAGTAMQRRRRSGVCVFQYLLVAEKGQLACSFVQCFHRQSAWKRGASKLCQHSASFQKFEVFPLHFFSNFFFFPSDSWFASLIVRSLAKRASAALALHYWASNKRCGSESSSSSVAQCACGGAAAAVMRVRF